MFKLKHLTFLITLVLTFPSSFGHDWQGNGTFANDNITLTTHTISQCITKKGLGTLAISGFPFYISEILNDEWDTAWNVLVSELQNYRNESIVY